MERSVVLIHNPNPTGGVNKLDLRERGAVPGLGVWEMNFTADVVSLPHD